MIGGRPGQGWADQGVEEKHGAEVREVRAARGWFMAENLVTPKLQIEDDLRIDTQ